MPLLCDRPHVNMLDWQTARFVVGKICGVNAGGRRFEMGDEIPSGTLNECAMRQIYEPPLSLIETVPFAALIPELHAACLSRGVRMELPVATVETIANEMCVNCGEYYPAPVGTTHSREECNKNRKKKKKK